MIPSAEVIDLAREAWNRKGMKPLTADQERVIPLIGKVPARPALQAA